jgi:hypothetical protein
MHIREEHISSPNQSDVKERLNIQFYWLPSNNYTSQVGILQSPLLPADLDQGPVPVRLYNCETNKKLCSGDEISLGTDDPVERRLSDFKLLEMQWFLHRVAAMSGAAKPQDDFSDDGDNSDDDR